MQDNKELFDLYMLESRENVELIGQTALFLEKDVHNEDYINSIFRAAHSIKGAAASMGFDTIRDITHRLEDLFGAIRENIIKVDSKVIDVVLKSVDCLENLHDKLEDDSIVVDTEPVLNSINSILNSLSKNKDSKKSEPAVEKKAESTKKEVDVITNSAFNESFMDQYMKTNFIDSRFFESVVQENLLTPALREILLSYESKENVKPYYIHIKIDEDCAYKAVRVFMLCQSLEKIGDIAAVYPGAEIIESDDFNGTDLDLIFATKENADAIKDAVNTVLEIEAADVINLFEYKEYAKNTEKTTVEEKEKTTGNTTATATTPAANNKKANAKTNKDSNFYVRVYTKTLDQLMNEQGELLLESNRMRLLIDTIKKDLNQDTETIKVLEDIYGNLSKILANQQSIIMSTRMVSLSQSLQKFPRIVRDLSSSLGKEIEFITIGEDTKLDRTVIDKVNMPLQHIIRNAVDHGIELPEERLAKNKSAQGTIKLVATEENNAVTITIEDDGKGLNIDFLKKKAIDKGLFTKEQLDKMSNDEIFSIIFMPGFSTAEVVTDISGRGVGMDVVKRDLSEIGGIIIIDSELGKGTKFTIKIPLTLAISKALLCEVENDKYIILFNQIEEVKEIPRSEIKSVAGKEHIVVRDRIYPLISLREIFNYPPLKSESESVVLIQNSGKYLGVVIDNWIGQQNIVVKNLNDYFTDVKYISGITKLGDGSLPMILDINAVMDDVLA